jgi:very-long-chain (3R)-3-hydroxyacyl-CoA dehydratase
MSTYFISYNLACVAIWVYIDALVILHFCSPTTRGDHASLWRTVSLPLKIAQTAAFLEVFHAAAGWVRSNAATAFVQVAARNFVLWAVMDPFPSTRGSWALPLCVGAWAAVEVPRYAYYVWELVFGKGAAPFALAWLRYSLFIVLYPLGILGEVGCILFALPSAGSFAWNTSIGAGNALNVAYNHQLLLCLLLPLYIPATPLMIGHMWAARGKWLKEHREKRA